MLSDYQLQVLLVLHDIDGSMITQSDLTQKAGLRIGHQARYSGLLGLSRRGLITFHKIINHRSPGPSAKVIELTEAGRDYIAELDGGEGIGVLKAVSERGTA